MTRRIYAPFRCAACFGTGKVMARHKERPEDSPYIFRCVCKRGEYQLRCFPFWNVERLKDFEIIPQGDFVADETETSSGKVVVPKFPEL